MSDDIIRVNIDLPVQKYIEILIYMHNNKIEYTTVDAYTVEMYSRDLLIMRLALGI